MRTPVEPLLGVHLPQALAVVLPVPSHRRRRAARRAHDHDWAADLRSAHHAIQSARRAAQHHLHVERLRLLHNRALERVPHAQLRRPRRLAVGPRRRVHQNEVRVVWRERHGLARPHARLARRRVRLPYMEGARSVKACSLSEGRCSGSERSGRHVVDGPARAARQLLVPLDTEERHDAEHRHRHVVRMDGL